MPKPPPRHWLIKSEPSTYAYAQLEEDGRTAWTGIRNFEARNNLRAMSPGDLCLFYHSSTGKAVVGVARVVSEPGADPTAPGEDWASVDVAPVIRFEVPVELGTIKTTKALAGMQLLTHSRLSVIPLTKAHFDKLLVMGRTKLRSNVQRVRTPRSRADR